MTSVFNDPSQFRAEAMDGFAAAFQRYVTRVPNASGFLRASGPMAGKVSLVVGGGSGHYPSYGGIVGAGLADACVLGDVFTSPSTEQIYRVAKAANGGAGILLAFGNYAGDRLNFGAARERLLAAGIDTRIVYVTDDIASAPPEEADKRRGIAGTVVVYKVGGAAVDAGYSLDDVERVMKSANAASFSLGVAFAGCTFPGQDEPLFTVEAGQLELGLGIHGEPGIRSEAMMPARELAALLVDGLLEERPADGGARAAVVLNGLGATKYEELFVLYNDVQRLLVDAGVEPVMTEVGELVSSLDMAGCSLSLTWLDEELETLWCAPAHSVAFRRGDVVGVSGFEPVTREAIEGAATDAVAEASQASLEVARIVRTALASMAATAHDAEQRLGRMDAVAGDGDHGVGMVRGCDAAAEAAAATQGGAGSVLREAAAAFGDRAGGTSGSLWGSLLGAIGASFGDVDGVDGPRLAAAMRHASDELQRIGGAARGDKTMLDALIPFVEDLEVRVEGSAAIAPAWQAAAEVATREAEATAQLKASVGRARPLAERSVGTPDPGAVSMSLLLTTVGEVLAEEECAR
jgi:D-erythrulose 4-kinase